MRDAVRSEWASLPQRNGQGREPHDQDQARAGRRIEVRKREARLGTGLAQTASTPEVRKIWSDLAKTWLRFATDLEANERC